MEDTIRRTIKGNVSLAGGDVDVNIQFSAPASIKIADYVQMGKDLIDAMSTGNQMKFDFDSTAVGTGMTIRLDKLRKGSKKCSIGLDGTMAFEAQAALHAIMQRGGKVTVSFKGEPKPKPEKKGDQAKAGKTKDIPIKQAVSNSSVLVVLEKAGITTVQAGIAMNIAEVKKKTDLSLDTLEAVVQSCTETLEQTQKPKDSKIKTGASK